VFVHGDGIRTTARTLREEGWSLRAIAAQLGIGLSTASLWVRDVAPDQRRPAPDDARGEALPVWTSGRVRTCSRCRRHLPEELFSRHGKGLQWWCKRCFAGYRRGLVQGERPRARARDYVMTVLARCPCTDCGEADPVVLEFDHVGPKRAGISELVHRGAPVAAIAEELRHCEVVCVNCHRRRTARRSGSWRLAPEQAPMGRRRLRHRNREHVARRLQASGCVDCGETDLVVLDFDHLNDKTQTISRLVHSECSLERLDEELAKCEIRCACCHRRRTASAGGFWRAVASVS
jgi:hypothetical protein